MSGVYLHHSGDFIKDPSLENVGGTMIEWPGPPESFELFDIMVIVDNTCDGKLMSIHYKKSGLSKTNDCFIIIESSNHLQGLIDTWKEEGNTNVYVVTGATSDNIDNEELADVLYASNNDDEEFDELKTQAVGSEKDDPDYNVSSDILDDSYLNWSVTNEEKLTKFKGVVVQDSIKNSASFKYVRNESERVRENCKTEACDWATPNFKLAEFQKLISEQLNISIAPMKASRARATSRKNFLADYEKEFCHIYRCQEEIIRSNLRFTV
ncbi:hypothetical protein ACFE04_023162 [Oxalis oulophora]